MILKPSITYFGSVLPVVPGLYGFDDVVTGSMGVLGRDWINGTKIDRLDSYIYIASAVVPVFPSSVTLYPLLSLRRVIENGVYYFIRKEPLDNK